jgi:hypothetical protein
MAAKVLSAALLLGIAGTALAAPAIAVASLRMYEAPQCFMKYEKCCHKQTPRMETCYKAPRCYNKQVCSYGGGGGKDDGGHSGGHSGGPPRGSPGGHPGGPPRGHPGGPGPGGPGPGGPAPGRHRTIEETTAVGGEAVDASVKNYGGCYNVWHCETSGEAYPCHKGAYHTAVECSPHQEKRCEYGRCDHF